jgi:hyperosmotically inducible periplasmic protein
MTLKKLKTSAAVAFALGSLLAAPAWAQIADKFRGLDVNGDGYISRDEASRSPGLAEAFDVADEDHDGRLTQDEFIKAESLRERQQATAYVTDTELTTKVKAALLRERGLKSNDVHVESDHGTVLLSGWVGSEEQHRKAVAVAKLVPGVKSVKDAIAVR